MILFTNFGTKCNQIYNGLLIKSKLKKKHIHHLYVAASFAARGRDTDLLNGAFKTRNFQTSILCHRQL